VTKLSTKTGKRPPNLRGKKYYPVKKMALNKCPQKKGTALKVFITTPKKPNSAARKTVKVILLSNKKTVCCHIPGVRHTLQKYSTVLVRGAQVRDLPGIKYRVVRGKFDLKRVYDRTKSRSKYGVPKLDS
jgi:small subunit ribosomal protein S12